MELSDEDVSECGSESEEVLFTVDMSSCVSEVVLFVIAVVGWSSMEPGCVSKSWDRQFVQR